MSDNKNTETKELCSILLQLQQKLHYYTKSDFETFRYRIHSILGRADLTVDNIETNISKFHRLIWYMFLTMGMYKLETRAYPYFWKIPRRIKIWSKNINTIKDFIEHEGTDGVGNQYCSGVFMPFQDKKHGQYPNLSAAEENERNQYYNPNCGVYFTDDSRKRNDIPPFIKKLITSRDIFIFINGWY
jgi:hypothetical protein